MYQPRVNESEYPLTRASMTFESTSIILHLDVAVRVVCAKTVSSFNGLER